MAGMELRGEHHFKHEADTSDDQDYRLQQWQLL